MADGRSRGSDLRRVTLLLIVGGILFALGVFSSAVARGFGELEAARAERRRLEAERRRLERRVVILQETLHRIRTDPAAMEAYVRRELGWIRPGETVLLLATPTPVPRPEPLTRPAPTPIFSLRE